jgi:[protein-PII] uridylyltransferase
VRAHDTVGLLYRIARALAEAGLDVRSARISTLGAEAVDAFYVVDSDGLPLADDDRRSEVADAVLAAISR